MNKNSKKILVAGASLLMVASVGISYNSSNVSAKSRTRVVRISHLKKWQRNRINHAKYSRNKNNRKIKLLKSYLKHHKHGKRVSQYRQNLSNLSRQNEKLNHQIYQYSYKRIKNARSFRHGYLPKRFNGSWYASETIDSAETKHHQSRHVHNPVYMRCNRHGDYMKSPHYRGYFHPKYWAGGFYSGPDSSFGVIKHGRTLVFNSETRDGRQASWNLYKI